MIRKIIEKRSNGDIFVYQRDRIMLPDGSEMYCQNNLDEALELMNGDINNGLPIKISVQYL